MIEPAPLIDSHLHLWRLGEGYEWLANAPEELRASFTAADAELELRDAGVAGAVLVQADGTLSDTEAMLDVAATHQWVRGVVGWVEFENPVAARSQLDTWQRHERFVGVRPSWNAGTPGDWLAGAPVRESLRGLADRGLTLDIPDAWPGHLADVADLAAALPDLPIVIDHLGKPPLGRADMDVWSQQLARVASHDNTSAKLSGLRRPGQNYTASELRPVFESALELFGPERLMWGSDWPITVPHGGYGPTLDVLRELIATLTSSEQRAIYSGSVAQFYSLKG